MKEFVEKLIERLYELQEIEGKKCDEYAKLNMGDYVETYNHGECCYLKAIQIVNQLAEEYKHCCLCYSGIPCEYQNKNAILPDALLANKNGWIPCSERLPEEPDIQFQALNFFPEYNVTIDGAEKSTTLHYLGDGEWSDAEGNSYNVIAWQQLPKVYRIGEELQERSIG